MGPVAVMPFVPLTNPPPGAKMANGKAKWSTPPPAWMPPVPREFLHEQISKTRLH